MEKTKTFEQSLAELEEIVKALESGDIDLDMAVKKYQKGMELSKRCHTLLKDAEEVIVKMMKDEELVDLESE
ncbi:MAG: exodeoxyribonuclease VII small subunit [Candidatus Izemoplasmataceae bacterium]